MSDLAALGGAQAVVCQVYDLAKQLVLDLVSISTNTICELLCSHDRTDIECGGQFCLGTEDATAVAVTGQQHNIQHMRSHVEIRSSGSLEFLTSIQALLDQAFGVDIVVTEEAAGLCTLKASTGVFDIEIEVHCVKFVIGPDGTNVLREDLVSIIVFAEVAKHDRHCQLFVQLHTIDVVQVLDIVEVCDVDDVITMQSGFHIDSLRVGRPANQLEVAGLGFLFALLISPGAKIVVVSFDISDIHISGADPGDRTFMYFVENERDPALIIRQELWCSRPKIFIFGEQPGDITVGLRLKEAAAEGIVLECIVHELKTVITGKSRKCGLESHAGLFGHSQDCLLIGMGQSVPCVRSGRFKHIVFHFFFLLGFFFVFTFAVFLHTGDDASNENINRMTLPGCQLVENILNRLFLFRFFGFFFLLLGFRFVLF